MSATTMLGQNQICITAWQWLCRQAEGWLKAKIPFTMSSDVCQAGSKWHAAHVHAVTQIPGILLGYASQHMPGSMFLNPVHQETGLTTCFQ